MKLYLVSTRTSEKYFVLLNSDTTDEFRVRKIIWPDLIASKKPEGQSCRTLAHDHPSREAKIKPINENEYTIENDDTIDNKYVISYKDEKYTVAKNGYVKLNQMG